MQPAILMFLASLLASACVASADNKDTNRGKTSKELEPFDSPSDSVYVRLETANSAKANGVSYRLSGVNGQALPCPEGRPATACLVRRIVVPDDCKRECLKDLVSGAGTTIARGSLSLQPDVQGQPGIPTLKVHAAFTLPERIWGEKNVYRIEGPRGHIAGNPVRKHGYRLTKIGAEWKDSVAISALDFRRSTTPDFDTIPQLANEQALGPEGLLVSGNVSHGVFMVERTWFLRTSGIACDTHVAARQYWFTSDSHHTDVEFSSENQVAEYPVTDGESLRWLVLEDATETDAYYVAGFDERWTVRFSVERNGCVVVPLGRNDS